MIFRIVTLKIQYTKMVHFLLEFMLLGLFSLKSRAIVMFGAVSIEDIPVLLTQAVPSNNHLYDISLYPAPTYRYTFKIGRP